MPFRHLLNEYATFSFRGNPKEIHLVSKIFLILSKVLHTPDCCKSPDMDLVRVTVHTVPDLVVVNMRKEIDYNRAWYKYTILKLTSYET